MEWLWYLIVGALAGGLASKVMHTQSGFLMNAILGIVGASIGSWLFSYFGWSEGTGLIASILVAAIGALIPVGIWKLITK